MSIGLGIGNSVSGKVSGFGGGGGPFNPIDLNPLIYLDANVGVTESAGLVSAWADQSGNNNDFTQVTGSLQPEYQATGLNSLPSIYFDGTEEMISATLSSALQEMSFYAVFVQTSASAIGPTIIGQTSGATNKRIFTTPPDSDSRVFLWDGGTGSVIASSVEYNYLTPIVAAFRENTDASGDGKINDGAFSIGESVTSATSSDLPIKLGNRGAGAARRLVGKISELIIYPTVHTDSQSSQVIDYLMAKWNIIALENEAIAYIAAAGITDPTEQAAVNQLVLDLKGSGSTTNNTDVWGSSYAIYPLSPTSLAAAEYNLKDPTQNITWVNSPTHATTGITGNGSNAYGLTGYNPVSLGWDKSNAGLTYSGEYSEADYPLGSLQNPKFFGIRNAAGFKGSYVGSNSTAALAATTARNVATASRTSTTSNKMFINGVQIVENINSELNDLPNVNIMVLALANGASPFSPFAGEIDFAALHTGLTNNQAKDLSDAITTYNTAVRTDPDAIAYIAAAGITGVTEQAAINKLVLDLKGEGSTINNTNVWDNFYALYPMCPIDGSTATLDGFKYNLKDPRDLDAAFRIDWFNSPTATRNGVTGNGSDEYGNTHFNTNTTAILNDHSFGFFGGRNGNMMGATPAAGNNPYNSYFGSTVWGINGALSTNASLTDGFVLTQRTGATTSAIYNNSTTPDATSTAASSSKPNFDSYLLARNLGGTPSGYSSSTFNLFFYGSSFTTNQIQDFYDAITTYNTALGR